MHPRKKMAEGFAHSYILYEKKVVVDRLNSGHLKTTEWNRHRDELHDLAGKYSSREIDPEQFLRERRSKTREIMNQGGSQGDGLTIKKAESLYDEIDGQHTDLLKEAHISLETPVHELVYRTLRNKLSAHVARIRYT
jgi:hypothetical protein